MSWRTVVISRRCKLDLKMGYLVVRGDEVKRVFLDEIAMLIIEDPAVSLTGLLLEALNERKVKVIFCDSKRSPMAELVPYYGSHDTSKKIESQINWSEDIKTAVWTDIIAEKLRRQAAHLEEYGFSREPDMIYSYIEELELGDATNREGHAAKVYFNALFGMEFTRSEDCITNAALNYGYGLILSAFNREIAANGYLTQLGLHHSNMFNQFNLSSDLMEPFRILVDRQVKCLNFAEFGASQKYDLVRMLEGTVRIDGTNQTVLNAVKIYTRSVLEALNDRDVSRIKMYSILE